VTAEATAEVVVVEPTVVPPPTAEATPEAAATVAVAVAPTVEPTPEATAEATAEAVAVEPTPVPPTATPVPPTATPVPPTATPVPPTATPTATEAPVATPEATPEATAEATAEVVAEATAEATAVAVAPTVTPMPTPVCRTTGELIVGTDAAYPPFENVNTETGEIEGFDIDLLNAIAAKAGFTPVYQNVPFDTIFTNLAAGQYDIVISATTITEERQQTVLFSNPYFAAAQVLTVRAADAETITSVEALAGRKVGVQKGTTGADFAKSLGGFEVVEYETTPEAMRALANGDVDAVIADDAPSKTILLNNPELNLAITVEALTVEYYGIAVRLECTELIEAINAALAEVIKEGTYAEIYRRYFGVDPIKELQEGGAGLPSLN
jgi:ABC-type amino acid transport substrate-binding protein